MRTWLARTSLVAGLAWMLGGVAMAQTHPEFRLGFGELARQIPAVVGDPLENEHWGINGDSLQQTSTGLMVWRKEDNWTAFTNGSRSWINGPVGVQERANEERFDWEKNGAALGLQSTPQAPAAPTAPVSSFTTATTTPTQTATLQIATPLSLPVDRGVTVDLRRELELGYLVESVTVTNADSRRPATKVDLVEYYVADGVWMNPGPSGEGTTLGPGRQLTSSFGASPASSPGLIRYKSIWIQMQTDRGRSAAILYFATWRWMNADGSSSEQVRSPHVVAYSN